MSVPYSTVASSATAIDAATSTVSSRIDFIIIVVVVVVFVIWAVFSKFDLCQAPVLGKRSVTCKTCRFLDVNPNKEYIHKNGFKTVIKTTMTLLHLESVNQKKNRAAPPCVACMQARRRTIPLYQVQCTWDFHNLSYNRRLYGCYSTSTTHRMYSTENWSTPVLQYQRSYIKHFGNKNYSVFTSDVLTQ